LEDLNDGVYISMTDASLWEKVELTMYIVMVKLIFVKETCSSVARESIAGRQMLEETGEEKAANEAM
jgi:hypothetical protein